MVAANGIYRLSVLGTVGGQQHVHTLHFRSTIAAANEALSESDYQQQIIDTWQGTPRDKYRLLFEPDMNPCEQYQVRKVCGSVPLPAGVDESEVAPNIVGATTTSADNMAPWLASVVTLRTGLAGRRYRGRFFLGGLVESDVNGATITGNRPGYTTDYVNALAAAFITPDELTKKAALFVFSRLLAAVPGVNCQNAGADVTNFQVRLTLATMKSRKAGHGN